MSNKHGVVWSSGAFITPHLFEAQEAFLEGELRLRTSVSRYANWGVSDLAVDTERLKTGAFVVTKCVAVFSDGTVNDTLPIARVVRKGGIYELASDYIPPCLNVACCEDFWERLGKLETRLEFVASQLAKDRSIRSELIADFEDSDIRRFWVLHLINQA